MELSPNYSGTLMGMTTTLANMAGFLGPLFTGAITKNNVIILGKKSKEPFSIN